MASDTTLQNDNIANLILNLDDIISSDIVLYQVSKSSEIKNNIFSILQTVSQDAHSYVLNINRYIRNNVKDSSLLKKSMIEKIQANMGD